MSNDSAFEELVRTHFEFLVTDYGFDLISSTPDTVRFESKNVFFKITYDDYSFEIETYVGLLAEDPTSYSQVDVLDALLGEANIDQRFFQASSPERMKYCVTRLAHLVRSHYEPVLRGEKEVLRKIDLVVCQKSDALAKEDELRNLRGDAEKAWRDKDYRKLVELFEPVKADLTPSEAGKLAYAKRKAAAGK